MLILKTDQVRIMIVFEVCTVPLAKPMNYVEGERYRTGVKQRTASHPWYKYTYEQPSLSEMGSIPHISQSSDTSFMFSLL